MARKITRAESRKVSEIAKKISPETFRTVMSTGNRPIDKRRLSRMESGTARLKPEEISRLESLSYNRTKIKNLEEQNRDKTPWKRRHALRDWIAGDKEAGVKTTDSEKSARATKGLRYLGVDTSKKKWYPKKKGKK